jgi:hypothetical protein
VVKRTNKKTNFSVSNLLDNTLLEFNWDANHDCTDATPAKS